MLFGVRGYRKTYYRVQRDSAAGSVLQSHEQGQYDHDEGHAD